VSDHAQCVIMPLSSACELAYVEHGARDAAPLVLASSLGTTNAMWDPQAAVLAERYRVIRYDTRGHGASPAPAGPYAIDDLGADVLALLERLELERVSFCGLSIGGMTGLWLAANAPERIRRLVVVCSSPHLPPAQAWAERAQTVRAADSTEPIADAVVSRWLTPAYAQAHPEIRQWLRSMLVSCQAEGYASCCAAIERMDLRDALPAIRAPALIIGGEFDLATPPDQHARVIAERVPGARLELVPAAHLANVELPDAVTQLIIDHLDHEESHE
jgi:3-oxoadipate enol-lactonase